VANFIPIIAQMFSLVFGFTRLSRDKKMGKVLSKEKACSGSPKLASVLSTTSPNTTEHNDWQYFDPPIELYPNTNASVIKQFPGLNFKNYTGRTLSS
jgi:hypothetical protein